MKTMKKTNRDSSLQANKKAKKTVTCLVAVFICLTLCAVPVFAAGDGVTDPMNKAVDLLFAIFRIVGVAISGYGIFEFATAMKSHDGAQKNTSLLSIASGLLIVFMKEILAFVGVSF